MSRHETGDAALTGLSTAGAKREPALDGVRAIAILAVVAYHAHLPGTGGGFTGVDVFFVLSGFLITRILLREHEASGRISLLDFYARRARRLVPALTIVLLVTVGASELIVRESGVRGVVGANAIATAVFAQNFNLIRRSGDYFDPEVIDPLLHTWSLSVEEQFYFVWPLLLLLVLARSRGALTRQVAAWVVLAVTLASFAVVALAKMSPIMVFYAPWARAWELGAGALLACAAVGTATLLPSRTALIAGVAGLAAIVGSVAVLDDTIVSTPWQWVAPVVGSIAVIASATRHPTGPIARSLSARPLVWIGERSYGWYLWHYPVLVLAGYATNEAWWVLPAGIMASLVVADLSYRYVELPIRQQRAPFTAGWKGPIAASSIAIILTVVAGQALRSMPEQGVRELARDYVAGRCPALNARQVDAGRSCALGSDTASRDVLLWGDSHARSFAPLLDTLGDILGFRVTLRWRSGCPPILRLWSPHLQRGMGCRAFNDSIFASIRADRDRYAMIVLASRWASVFGTPPRDSSRHATFSRRVGDWTAPQLLSLGTEALRKTLTGLDTVDQRVLLLSQTAEWRHSPRDCHRFGPGACVDSTSVQEAFTRPANLSLLRVSRGKQAWLLNLMPEVCRGPVCTQQRDSVVMFFDINHLSPAGAQLLLPGSRCAFATLLQRGTLTGTSCPNVAN